MKKRILGLLICLALIISLNFSAWSDQELMLLAVNDSLAYSLDAGTMPYYSRGTLYIPYDIFNSSAFGIYTSYNPTTMTLILFNQSQKLLFDIQAGIVTDESGSETELSVSVKGNMVFVPAVFCSSHFGAALSTMRSETGCTVVRITTGTQVLSDSAFLLQAGGLIEERVAEYRRSVYGVLSDEEQTDITGAAIVAESGDPMEVIVSDPEPEPQSTPERDALPQADGNITTDTRTDLSGEENIEEKLSDGAADSSQEGAPGQNEVLITKDVSVPVILGINRELIDYAETVGIRCAVFLDAEDILCMPELVRRAYACQLEIGVRGNTKEALDAANDALCCVIGSKTITAWTDGEFAAEGYLSISAFSDMRKNGEMLTVIDAADADFSDAMQSIFSQEAIHLLDVTSTFYKQAS